MCGAEAIEDYIRIVREAKAKLTVPVIASINCTEAGSWVEFAERLRDAGGRCPGGQCDAPRDGALR